MGAGITQERTYIRDPWGHTQVRGPGIHWDRSWGMSLQTSHQENSDPQLTPRPGLGAAVRRQRLPGPGLQPGAEVTSAVVYFGVRLRPLAESGQITRTPSLSISLPPKSNYPHDQMWQAPSQTHLTVSKGTLEYPGLL